MRLVTAVAAVAAVGFAVSTAAAQTVPTSRDQVAYPGGHLANNPKVALVKIADGLHDPVGVAAAFDGTGFVEQGLWSIAFDPDFKTNHYFYVHYSSLPFNGAGVVLRVTADPSSPDVVSADQVVKTGKVVMLIPQPYYNHDGGMIQFGPDGFLY